jgi:cytosine/adenosine deaminase-related metal-dependent hydrolase
MSYRKLKADYLFDGFKMLSGVVLVIASDGTIESVIDEKSAGADPEKFSGILSPGFINCHCHLELSHLKGLTAEKQGLVNFVLSVMSQRDQPEELKQQAIRKAENEMLAAGIVAVGDICNTADSRIQKSENNLPYYDFIELLGWVPEQAEARYESGRRLAHLFKEEGQDENHLALTPHAPYSVSDDLWNRLIPGFKGKTIAIHNQESAAENEFFLTAGGDLTRMYSRMNIVTNHFKAPGTTSLSFYLPRLRTASKILLVHNTFMNEADLILTKSFGGNIYLCLCPNANLYIEDRLPDIPVFLKHKACIVLGTDSLASNHQLSILEEIKTIRNAFPKTPSSELLKWATSNGAKALSFDDQLGDFTKGKKPGIILIENLENGEIGAGSSCRNLV